jgi:hypothetical protein
MTYSLGVATRRLGHPSRIPRHERLNYLEWVPRQEILILTHLLAVLVLARRHRILEAAQLIHAPVALVLRRPILIHFRTVLTVDLNQLIHFHPALILRQGNLLHLRAALVLLQGFPILE